MAGREEGKAETDDRPFWLNLTHISAGGEDALVSCAKMAELGALPAARPRIPAIQSLQAAPRARARWYRPQSAISANNAGAAAP